MTLINWIFISLALAIIAVLSVVAIRLTMKVRTVEAQRESELKEREEKRQQQRAYLNESINVIAAAFLNEELTPSEAVIRCKMLLDGLMLSEAQRQPYEAIETVYQLVKNFDTHDARKALPANQRMKQDLQRESIEHEHRAQLVECFTLLKSAHH